MPEPVKQKKSVWDILDAVLEPAVQVYTGIRGTKVDGTDDNLPPKPPVPFEGCDEGYVLKDGKCVKEIKQGGSGSGTTLIIIGGVLVLGAAGYFIWKKFSNKTN
jgi:LPXTG-motif cell wall-anchored protein